MLFITTIILTDFDCNVFQNTVYGTVAYLLFLYLYKI